MLAPIPISDSLRERDIFSMTVEILIRTYKNNPLLQVEIQVYKI